MAPLSNAARASVPVPLLMVAIVKKKDDGVCWS